MEIVPETRPHDVALTPPGGRPGRRRRRARAPLAPPGAAPDLLHLPRGPRGGHRARHPGPRAGARRGVRLPDAGHGRRRVPPPREGALPGRPARAPHRAGRHRRHRGGGQPIRDLPVHLEALGRGAPAAHRPGRHRPVLHHRGEPAAPAAAHRPAGGARAAEPRARRQARGPDRGAAARRAGVAHLLRRHRRPARHHPGRLRGGPRQRRLRAPRRRADGRAARTALHRPRLRGPSLPRGRTSPRRRRRSSPSATASGCSAPSPSAATRWWSSTRT